MSTISGGSPMQHQGPLPQQNGAMSPSSPGAPAGHRYLVHQQSSTHAVGGYTMALSPRHDRVDYSMAKGGFRLWVVLFVFFMLLTGMITIFSNQKESIQVEVDIDSGDEFDVVDHDIVPETKLDEEETEESEIPFDSGPQAPDELEEDEVDEAIKETAQQKKPKERLIRKKVKRDVEEQSEPEPKTASLDEETLLGKLWEKAKKIKEGMRYETSQKRRARGQQKPAEEEELVEDKEEPAADKSSRRMKKPKAQDEQADQQPSAGREEVEVEAAGREAVEVEDESSAAPLERPKVRVIRVKGKPKEEMIVPTSPPSPPPPPPPAPVEEPPDVEEPAGKPKIQVRVIRKKGKPKEEIEMARETESTSDGEPAEDTTAPVAEDAPVKPQIKVRYVHIRGKKQDEQQSSIEEVVNEPDDDADVERKEEKPKIPVRVFRTRGRIPDPPEDSTKGKTTALKVPEYRKRAITNREDNKIRQLLDEADRLADERKLKDSLEAFDKVLNIYPRSPRARYGRARVLDLLAAEQQSSAHLDSCIREYEAVLRLPQVPESLQRIVTDRLVDRARFRGLLDKAAQAQRRLVDKFPNDLEAWNEFGVTYLMMSRHDDAKRIFETVLSKDPGNSFASAYYGYILKTVDDDYSAAVEHLQKGINDDGDGVLDGKFYFHLGDALQRLNRTEEAYDLYEKAAKLGIFLSKYQRSLYNVPGLTARPFWTTEETPYIKQLRHIEAEWKAIRDEGLSLIGQKSSSFVVDNDSLAVYGEMKGFVLFENAIRHDSHCTKAPKTCAAVTRFADAVSCTRGEIKFSLMESVTRTSAQCGPTNCRLRGHLGLVVPPEARVRVGEDSRSWRQGKFLIFDDSFEHEMWHDGTGFRLVLVVDFWHPGLTKQQKTWLTPI